MAALGAAAWLALIPASGCDTPKAEAADCRQIFDRLVVLELRAQGFDDPLLAELRQAELAERLKAELADCVGGGLPKGALACVGQARSSGVLSRECLR